MIRCRLWHLPTPEAVAVSRYAASWDLLEAIEAWSRGYRANATALHILT